MPSDYPRIDFLYETTAGTQLQVDAGVTVKARVEGAGSDVDEGPYTTDDDGGIAAGTINVVAGTVVHFRIEQFRGMATSVAVYTT
jgi:hypothetical protein